MRDFFDFSGIEQIKLAINISWDEFRCNLADQKFKYDDIASALNTTHLSVFNDLFLNEHHLFEKDLGDVLSHNTNIIRAAHIRDSDPIPTYARFIPTEKYITSHNRFSPPGVEWLYLAISPHEELGTPFSHAEICALKECRANCDEHYALCSFRLKDAYKNSKVVDLTIAKEHSYDDLNNNLIQCCEAIYKREFIKGFANIFSAGTIRKPQAKDFRGIFEKWVVYTYARLLSEQIFLPITTENREIMYAPFQCMAQYFLSLGYVGIVYSSTVFPEGKNIVLFDKEMAEPYNQIKNIIVPNHL